MAITVVRYTLRIVTFNLHWFWKTWVKQLLLSQFCDSVCNKKPKGDLLNMHGRAQKIWRSTSLSFYCHSGTKRFQGKYLRLWLLVESAVLDSLLGTIGCIKKWSNRSARPMLWSKSGFFEDKIPIHCLNKQYKILQGILNVLCSHAGLSVLSKYLILEDFRFYSEMFFLDVFSTQNELCCYRTYIANNILCCLPLKLYFNTRSIF